MNKNRIKQLAHLTAIGKAVDPQEYEKFAELLIKECAVQLDANRIAVYDPTKHHEYWNCGVKWAIAKIQNHTSNTLKYLDCDSK